MLGYIKSVIPNSACAVYLYNASAYSDTKMERLAWYDEEGISIPYNALALKSASTQTSLKESAENGLESRHVAPIVFQTRTVGAVDLYKPTGILPKELKMYQLLIDYVSSFWVLYDLIAVREQEASVDALTGIWNRRYMIRRFQEEMDRISRYNGNACVVLGDMGNFKYVNDNYGHTKGDEVLIKVAKTLRKCLRASDCVGRYGGDEFLMLLPNTSNADAGVMLERIKTEFGLLVIKGMDDDADSPVVDVILDFGIANYPSQAPTLMEAINVADEDMFANKIARKKRLGLPISRD
jgi:diguanylate cyclase (GGDEF)-like protein